jgi:hypothetical protein
VTRLATAQLLLLALCFANTPDRVAWYAARVPGLGFLAHADNAMAEYGYLHDLPGIGTLRSRLTMDELAERDRSDAARVAAVLDRYAHRDYERFLREQPATADPFLYEARVHIFSRDYHLRQLEAAEPGSAAAREHATIAAREHDLLERVFGRTLKASRFDLPPRQQALLEELADEDASFVSRSASHLVTSVPEDVLLALLVGSAAVLLLLDSTVLRRRQLEVAA